VTLVTYVAASLDQIGKGPTRERLQENSIRRNSGPAEAWGPRNPLFGGETWQGTLLDMGIGPVQAGVTYSCYSGFEKTPFYLIP
jgi:hypothetical protein